MPSWGRIMLLSPLQMRPQRAASLITVATYSTKLNTKPPSSLAEISYLCSFLPWVLNRYSYRRRNSRKLNFSVPFFNPGLGYCRGQQTELQRNEKRPSHSWCIHPWPLGPQCHWGAWREDGRAGSGPSRAAGRCCWFSRSSAPSFRWRFPRGWSLPGWQEKTE